MQSLQINIAESIEQAPNYAKDFPNVKSAILHQAIVVKKGTEEGNCTVDLVFVSADGTEHVALTTGAILRSLADIIAGIDNA